MSFKKDIRDGVIKKSEIDRKLAIRIRKQKRKKFLKSGAYKNKIDQFLKPIVEPVSDFDRFVYREMLNELHTYKCPNCNIHFHELSGDRTAGTITLKCVRCMYNETLSDINTKHMVKALYDIFLRMNNNGVELDDDERSGYMLE